MGTTLNPLFTELTKQDRIDIKRVSGQAPCAECKRLKLRCDKRIPCASCVRRGCDKTCPTGSYLPTGRGKRAVPTEASRLKATLAAMEERRRELESTITKASNYYLDTCPHLGLTVPGKRDPGETLADRLGALSVDDTGVTQYFGPTAGTEALLSIQVLDDPDADDTTDTPPIFDVVTSSFRVKAMAWDAPHALTQLLAHLPPKPRAWELAEVYFEHGCWSGTPIMRTELFALLARVYGKFSADNTVPMSAPTCSAHELAVLYGVFALAALVDLLLPPYNAESEYYFDLCRAALSVRSVFDDPQLATLQALVLTSIFYAHGGPRFSMESAWSVISLAATLGKNMGLHRERFHPEMAPEEVQRRRACFWELYAIETLQSLVVGRPSSTALADISCPFPTDDEQQIDDAGGIRPGFYHRRWHFIKQVAAPVMDASLTAKPPSYATIVELDQRIRKFMHSPMCTPPGAADDDRGSPALYVQRRSVQQSCAKMLVYIHNHACVRAILENPDDPYYTKHATSFLSGYRHASEIIRADLDSFRRHPVLCARWWPIWKSLFNAAMIVGAVAAGCPQNHYGPRALLELFVAVDLFEGGAASSFRARGALNVLRKLRAKAIAAYSRHSGDLKSAADADADADAALDVLAGRTRVIAQNIIARRTSRKSDAHVYPAPPSPDRDITLPLSDGAPFAFEPSLVEYFASASGRPEFDAGIATWTTTASGGGYEPAEPALFDMPMDTMTTFAGGMEGLVGAPDEVGNPVPWGQFYREPEWLELL
ncbi:fungal-specific transcription factor domain-containing protein [Mycena filopes]|nr:fungal-specific transcription factor domain-containing protein [Mycena filopes]